MKKLLYVFGVLLLLLFVAISWLEVRSQDPYEIYQSKCETTIDCYLKLTPSDFIKGYRTQCLKGVGCTIVDPRGIGPL